MSSDPSPQSETASNETASTEPANAATPADPRTPRQQAEEAAGDDGKKNILVKTWKDFSDDDGFRLAAALAYYTVLALPPMLVVVLVVSSFFFKASSIVGADTGTDEQTVIEQTAEEALGEKGSSQIAEMLKAARDSQKSGWAALIGFAILLFSASTAVAQLQAGLNDIWEVEPHPESTIKDFITKRVLSLGMVVGIGLLVVLSVTLSAAITKLPNELLPGDLAKATQSLTVNGVTAVLLTFLFAAMYKFLPDAKIAWKDTWVGAAVTAVLFVVAKWGLGLYLGRNDPGASYGDAGAIILILVWIYYSMLVVLFGAEFAQVYAKRYGTGILPDDDAVRVIETTSHVTGEDAKAVADV